MSAIIDIENLSKIYPGSAGSPSVRALNNLTMHVNDGEIFSYLGPNGSGKTTTIKILLGLIFPDAGTVRVMGREDITAPAVRAHIGYVPEGAYYPDFLKGEEVLRFYGNLYGMGGKALEKRIAHVLEQVGMTRARKHLIKNYSKGMRQRIGIAQALLGEPSLLILDEPTTGLDPIARKDIRDLLIELRQQGKTLLISSHELLEVELISDRVGIIFEGDLQTVGTVTELLKERSNALEVSKPSAAAMAALQERGIEVADQSSSRAVLHVPEKMDVYEALEICRRHDLTLLSVAPKRESLEEMFVNTVREAKGRKEAQA